MVNKLSLNYVIACFAFSMIFVMGGCAKKAMVAPEVETAKEAPIAEEAPIAAPTYEEETVFQGLKETPPDLFVGESSADFKEMVAPDSKAFKPAPNLEVVHFDFDRYNIRFGDREKLSRNAAWMNSNPNAFIRIEGHCDARGTSDYNLALGDRRANATKNYLVSLGVNPSRISTVTYGEERPLCSENMESCWSQNRRAEFLVAQ